MYDFSKNSYYLDYIGVTEMNATPTIGKRTNHRFQVLNCRVQLKSSGILGVFGKEIHQLSLIDLSATGVQVISPRKLDHRKEYDITILVPAFRHPISTKGCVVWNHPYTGTDNSQYYRIGLEFTYFKGTSMDRIEALELSPELRKLV
ncbi:MAG: hypothetical protein DSY90_00480 [Deltaproteobacteria bacterium]|nr:MAG: hypothetical protein DSY90_00480 [Deltaproteobacteria bacterium]